MPLPERPRAVITGAGSGLGRALALELAKRRARILVADINEAGAEKTVRLVAQAGAEAHATRCDVSKSEDVMALLGAADRTIGGVDLLVNNAGVAAGGPVGVIPLVDWEWLVGINLWGVIYGCHTFIPRFKEQQSGHILNVASAAGILTAPHMAPYNVTKAGVIALSETLRAELYEERISVTVLCPTFFRTNITATARAHGPLDPSFVDRLMDRATVQADGVARIAIEAVDAGRLYALPHRDGRFIWWFKRAFPELFYETLSKRWRTLTK